MTAQWTLINYVKNFDHTGGQQTLSIPYSGYYKLEVWGAQGGTYTTSPYRGGYGGYSVGIAQRTKSNSLYINVGGKGRDAAEGCSGLNNGSYNGGGSSSCTGGGGATHIATVSGQLSSLSSYRSTGGTNISKEILIVAGGGGAGGGPGVGGNGGGIQGNNAATNYSACLTTIGKGGTQTAGGDQGYDCRGNTQNGDAGSFGLGGSEKNVQAGSGGGGWYGGGSGSDPSPWPGIGGGGGGSGYIGSSNIISGGGITKHMTCYSCTTSTAAATRTNSNTSVSGTATADYSKTGNGYARIT